MKITRTTLVTAISKADKEGRDWCRGDFGRYYQIRIDTDDSEIWCDVYLDENSWDVYHSDSIHSLSADGYVGERIEAMADEAAELLEAAGWEVVE